MYSYIINDSNSATHFSKTYNLDTIKSCMLNETSTCNSHAYRIKDVTEAINKSVLLDVDKKATYNNWLTDDSTQFDASDEFVNICREVGECDVI